MSATESQSQPISLFQYVICSVGYTINCLASISIVKACMLIVTQKLSQIQRNLCIATGRNINSLFVAMFGCIH